MIPARAGSKGIPGKNSRVLNGKPLIGYAIEAAKKSRYLTDIIVSTDDENIASISRNFGAEIPFIRPSHLAEDNSPTFDVVMHALEFLESTGKSYHAVCLLQPTTPLRTVEMIDACIEVFLKNKTDSVLTVREVPMELNPHWVFFEDNDGFLKIATGEEQIIKRRQDLPPAYFRDGAIYLTNTEIIKGGSLYGSRIGYYLNTLPAWVNLDTLSDWDLAESILKSIDKLPASK